LFLFLSLTIITVMFLRPRETSSGGNLELKVEGTLTLNGKTEVVGNLVSGKLAGSGVESFSFGEYYEANPLISIGTDRVHQAADVG